jgi:hypothetical protein
MRKISFVVLAFVAIIVSALTLRHDAFAQRPASLTAMDYVEIQQLVNRLNFAIDYCTNGGRDFADLFVEGGTFTIDQGDGNASVRSTREELIALSWGPDCEARKTPPRSYILHLAESLVIEPTAEGARGVSYAIYPSSKGRYLQDDVAGQLGLYYDEYVKTAKGWRFKSRRHQTSPVVGEVVLP